MDNEKLMTTWCAMWNDDPAIAHEVMNPACRQWSAQTPGLDTVVGPADQEKFVTAYREQHLNVFRPRVLVDAGDRFAYLWDVTRPDGSVWTGADANTVSGGRVDENWTFVAQRRATSAVSTDPEPIESAVLQRLSAGWIGLWNGAPADDIVAVDVSVFIGAGESAVEVTGTRDLSAQVAAGSQPRGVHREAVLDPARGRVAVMWSGDSQVGLDVLAVHGGRVSHAWSVTGTRTFGY